MDIINAVESHFKHVMDVSAFEINVCVKDQSKENAFQKLVNAIQKFDKARSNYEIVQNLKSQLQLQAQPQQFNKEPNQIDES